MNKMNLQGEVTFLPLDRLQARREDYPSAPDALPLIDKINYAEGEKINQDILRENNIFLKSTIL